MKQVDHYSPGKTQGGVKKFEIAYFLHFIIVPTLNRQDLEGYRLPPMGEQMFPPPRGVLSHGFPKLLKKMPENENANNFQKIKKSS